MKLNDALPKIDGRSRDVRGPRRRRAAPRDGGAGAAARRSGTACSEIASCTTSWLLLQLVDSAFPTGGFAHSRGPRGGVAARARCESREELRRFAEVSDPAGGDGRPAARGRRATREPARLPELGRARTTRSSRTRSPTARAASRGARSLASARARLAVAGAGPNRRRTRRRSARTSRRSSASSFARARCAAARRRSASCSTAPRAACCRRPSGSASPAATRRSGCSPSDGGVVGRGAGALRRSRRHDLAQTAPVVDVLQGAHDRLYSRLFQS